MSSSLDSTYPDVSSVGTLSGSCDASKLSSLSSPRPPALFEDEEDEGSSPACCSSTALHSSVSVLTSDAPPREE